MMMVLVTPKKDYYCISPAVRQVQPVQETTMMMVVVTPNKDYYISTGVRQVQQPMQETSPSGKAQLVL
jgi:hypothetical protein